MAIQHYQGGCQCGAVRYEVGADTDKTYACNCSRCGRLGTVLAFTPEESFTLRAGEDSLTTYKFNKHVIDHQFCSVCGIQSFSRGKGPDGRAMVAINVRCLDGIDPHELKPEKIDGRSY